jgi:hypothetical protein
MEHQLSANRTYLNHLASIILDSAITVHKEMGPGLLEAVYHHCMLRELQCRELAVSHMTPVPLYYKGTPLNKDYIIDLLEAQIMSYLKLADKRLGFLINFNVPLLKQGFRRFVNRF